MSEFSAQVEFQVWPNDGRQSGSKQPNHRGSIVMTKTLLQEMVKLVKANEEVVLQVALWENTTKNTNKNYLFGKLSVDEYKVNKNREANGGGKPEPEAPKAEEVTEEELFG